MQLLLDSRSSVSLDLQVQQHAHACHDCRAALDVYLCFSDLSRGNDPASSRVIQSAGNREPQPISAVSSHSAKAEWKRDQQRQVRRRFGLAVAALLFVSFILVAQPNAPAPVALESGETVASNNYVVLNQSEINGDATANESGFLVGSLTSFANETISYGAAWTGTIANSSLVDLSSLGRLDLIAFVPEQSVRAVQQLPATIGSMEPLYRYSSDFPVISRWSTGINYTIGLIQSSLPQSSPSTQEDDLGRRLNPNSFGIDLA